MQYRPFGRSGLRVSALGFGAWAIGGKAYGPVEAGDSLNALARAEELGCNFVDTAAVYGNSEAVLGQFLPGRRDKWIVATKYSGQDAGMTATLESQLRALKVDAVDLYQIHWVPRGKQFAMFEELERLKVAGKTRLIGVSLYSKSDIDFVLARSAIDSVQIKFGLLDPLPMLARVEALRSSGLAVIVRSCLKEGFLSGKFNTATAFTAADDQRSQWSRGDVLRTLEQVERFRFLEAANQGSLVSAAVRYPLSYDCVSTVILGTKTAQQAQQNFSIEPVRDFGERWGRRIDALQKELGLWPWRERLASLASRGCSIIHR